MLETRASTSGARRFWARFSAGSERGRATSVPRQPPSGPSITLHREDATHPSLPPPPSPFSPLCDRQRGPDVKYDARSNFNYAMQQAWIVATRSFRHIGLIHVIRATLIKPGNAVSLNPRRMQDELRAKGLRMGWAEVRLEGEKPATVKTTGRGDPLGERTW